MQRVGPAIPWLAAVVLLAVVAPQMLLALVAILTLIALPGWALVVLLVPPTADRPGSRVLGSLALGLAAAVLLGVVTGITPFGATGAIAILLLAGLVIGLAMLTGRLAVPEVKPVDVASRQIGLLGLAVLLAIGSFGIARAGLSIQATPEVTGLWILPTGDGAGARLGVVNEGNAEREFRLIVATEAGTVEEFAPITLGPGGRWEGQIEERPDEPLRATLFDARAPETPHREVVLAAPGAP